MPELYALNPQLKDVSANVIFVHGLANQGESAFGMNDNVSWKSLLSTQIPNAKLWIFEYDASRSIRPRKDTTPLPLVQRAETFRTELVINKNDFDKTPLIFVSYSLGGLVTKQLLTDTYSHKKDIGWLLDVCRGVVFIATPHKGQRFANVLHNIANCLTSPLIDELRKNQPSLTQLNKRFEGYFNELQPEVEVLIETRPYLSQVVVPEESADPRLPHVYPKLIEKHHLDICKVTSVEESVYKLTKILIENCIKNNQESDTNSKVSIDEVAKSLPVTESPKQLQTAISNSDIEQARERLKQMPLDEVPEPQDLPIVSKMPHPVNPNFVGREDELKELAKNLKEGTSTAITATTGIGGIGKSQLAAEFVHRYGKYFEGGVFWLSFSDPNSIPAEVAECGNSEHLALDPKFTDFPFEEQVKQVSSCFKSGLPKLLIFDNCEDTQLLEKWRPTQGNNRILLTSRQAEWSIDLGVKPITLNKLTRPQSIELLRKYRPDLNKDDNNLDALSDVLGDLPLALQLAGNYLKTYQHSSFGKPEEYLKDLQNNTLLNHGSLQGKGSVSSATGHELHVAKTFMLSFEKLNETTSTDILALKILRRAAYFAPDNIPRLVLFCTLEPDGVIKEQLNSDYELELEDAIIRLLQLGLIQKTENGDLSLHRLIALFIKDLESEGDTLYSVEHSLLQQAKIINHVEAPSMLLLWQPHLRFVTENALENETEISASLSHALAYHLKMIADYAGAENYYDKALAIRKKVLGENHFDTANTAHNYGALYLVQGDYIRAEKYFRYALSINENIFGKGHAETATNLDSIGLSLRGQGDYKNAKSYLSQSLEINKKYLKEGHPSIANNINSLALVFHDIGYYKSAESYYREALLIRRKSLRKNHPNIGDSLNNLGIFLKERGKHKSARPYIEEALQIFETEFGENHPETATCVNNLGLILQEEKDYKGAMLNFEKALNVAKSIDDENPDVAYALNNIAYLQQLEGNIDAARQNYQKAVNILEKTVGKNNSNTKAIRQNLDILNIYH